MDYAGFIQRVEQVNNTLCMHVYCTHGNYPVVTYGCMCMHKPHEILINRYQNN